MNEPHTIECPPVDARPHEDHVRLADYRSRLVDIEAENLRLRALLDEAAAVVGVLDADLHAERAAPVETVSADRATLVEHLGDLLARRMPTTVYVTDIVSTHGDSA